MIYHSDCFLHENLSAAGTAIMEKFEESERMITKLLRVNVLVSQGRNVANAMRESGLKGLTYYAPYIVPNFPIAYLHIPRTAGTALSQMLAEHWRKVLLIGTWQQFGRLHKDQIENALLVSGHFRAFQIEKSTFERFRVLTVVRDPLARAISSYRYAHRRGIKIDDLWGPSIENLDNPDMEPGMRFAADHNFIEWFHSKYGRVGRHAQLYILGANADENVPELIARAGEAERKLLFSEWLERAKRRLDKMLVGIFEQIELYAVLLESALGLPRSSLPRVNTSDGVAVDKIDLNNYQRMEMQQILELDYDLYEYAKARFSQQYQKHVAADPHQLNSGSASEPSHALRDRLRRIFKL
jgi:Sulfotransferase family